ncbi:SsuA/THI5-like [Moorella glycerini]|uniref:Aliphatic sulfonates-binding protein n=1 Tax=Neomoorella stamsii TaxID=1266720 RepID=A0A9X7P7I3_9FIRM|nr:MULTISPECIES: ABC transporter substrate-binding protein [Moorella]PRR76662.1 putative aliphatic sulfonates-binding protein precursor [Moorella stamsii]CEP66804.1 SsuA/THI5-like [Moorella glycerini]
MKLTKAWLIGLLIGLAFIVTACGGSQEKNQEKKETSSQSTQAEQSQSKKNETVRVLYSDSVFSLTTIVGLEKGFFAEEGLNVNAMPLSSGGMTVSGLIGKSADFAVGSFARFLDAVNKDLPIIAVGVTTKGFQGYVIVPPDSNAKSIEDLKGKDIAVQMGSGTSSVFLRYLESKGLSPKDFKIREMDTELIPAAFEAKQVAAGVPWDPFATQIIEKGVGKVLLTPKDLAEPVKATYAFPLLTLEETIKKRPEMVQKFLNAWVKSLDFIHHNREEAIDILRAAFVNQVGLNVSREAVKNMVETTYYTESTFDDEDIKDAYESARIFYDFGITKNAPPSLEKIKAHVNNTFAEKAEAQFRKK